MNNRSEPIYDSGQPGHWLLGDLRELLAYRGLLRLLVVSQLKQRYRRSLLGMGWLVIGPLLSTAVLSVAFSALFEGSISNYPAYVLVGLVAWNFFAQASVQGVEAAISGSGLLQRVYLPRSIFVVAAIGGAIISMAAALAALLAVLLAGHAPLHLTWLLLPPAIALLAIFTLGITLGVATLAVLIGDIAQIYPLLVQALFFLTPVVYPREIVPGELRWMIQLNPLGVLIELFRALLYQGRVPRPEQWLLAGGIAVGALAAGWALFAWKSEEYVCAR